MSRRKRARLQTEKLPDADAAADEENHTLSFAAATGDARTVRRLLSRKVESNAEKRAGTLIHVAAGNGHAEVVKVLLNHGASCNETNEFFDDFTPVHLAALEGKVQVLSVLLSRGAFVDAKNESGITPLHITASQNEPECAKLLLDFKADVNVADANDVTPLHVAAHSNYVEMVRVLLDAGADINAAEGRTRTTPLHCAALNGSVEVVKLLLKQKACFDVKDKNRKTPLYYAITNNKLETAELLLNHPNSGVKGLFAVRGWSLMENRLLHSKSLQGSIKTMGWLLSKGANVNAVNAHDETPLHTAAVGGHPRAVKLLLSAGAFVDARRECGGTPLHLAAMQGHAGAAKVLLSGGADANAVNHFALTPIHFAAGRGYASVVKLLLSAGASVDVKNKLDMTPLHLAAWNGHRPVVTFLLSAGADVNAVNFIDQTPLGCSADPDCREVLQQQVVKMMSLNLFVSETDSLAIRSDDKMTSFQISCEEEIERMKRQKFENGASFFDILTKNTRQLIMYAWNKDMVRVFRANFYLSMFPIYSNKIKNRFIPAIERAKLLEAGHKFFDITFQTGLPWLEFTFTDEILMYLRITDLQILRDLVKCIKIKL